MADEGLSTDLVVRALALDGGEGTVVFGDEAVLARAAETAGVPTPDRLGAEVRALMTKGLNPAVLKGMVVGLRRMKENLSSSLAEGAE